ncbi:MAG: hypothetical protein EOM50_16255 [Erysipelotrichia bacterium]|nr:hypothetical protein [Erysipelotrichia bacterium]
MKKILLIVIKSIGFAMILFLSGCGTTTPQIQSKMTRTISVNPNILQEKVVFLRVTGTEASVMDLEQPLRQALIQKGVKLVDNPSDAKISIHINTLFANNLKEAVTYKAAAFGGTTAAVASRSNGNSTGDSILIGIGVALAMGVAENALADETYRAVVDVTLRTKKSDSEWSDEDKTRILVEAVQMGLNVQKAKPIMEEQVIQKISDILK